MLRWRRRFSCPALTRTGSRGDSDMASAPAHQRLAEQRGEEREQVDDRDAEEPLRGLSRRPACSQMRSARASMTRPPAPETRA